MNFDFDPKDLKLDVGSMEKLMSDSAMSLARKTDEVITQAFDKHLGEGTWTIDGLVADGRVSRWTYEKSNFLAVICLDRNPIIALGPVKLHKQQQGDEIYLNASRRYKIL
jgi:hypothetical protein